MINEWNESNANENDIKKILNIIKFLLSSFGYD
jgi:hypothetical protein